MEHLLLLPLKMKKKSSRRKLPHHSPFYRRKEFFYDPIEAFEEQDKSTEKQNVQYTLKQALKDTWNAEESLLSSQDSLQSVGKTN